MFEGKNLHFSPVDNKPLCSYSSKLCRQRRLNGYAFCIRHILEDKSAPFKRCTYVTRNNNQICQNAIPTSQERGYCHSHMQVAGIIPKTERKVKNPPKSADANGTSGKSSDSNSNSSNSSSGGVKKDPNAVFKFEEEPSEIQWIPKGGRINGIVNSGKKVNGKGKDQVKEGVVNGTIHTGSSSGGGKSGKSEINKNGKVNQSALMNGKDTPVHVKSRQTYGKKPTSSGKKSKVIIESTTVINKQASGSLETTTTNGSGNLTENVRFGLEVNILDSNVTTPPCAPEHDKYFDQLKTLKSVEKSVSHSKQDSSDIVSAIKQSHMNNNASSKPTNSPRTIPIPKSTTLPNSRNSSSNKNCSNVGICTSSGSSISSSSSVCVDLFNSICAQKVTNSLLPEFSPDKITIKSQNSSFEPRQEFLARVRQAFKLQYLTIKNSANDSDKNEKIWKRALRHSLLTCVAKNSSYCAHVIVQNDPKKYSDLVMVGNGKKSPAPKSSKKSANMVASNGNNNNHNKSRRKNGLADSNPSGGGEKSESRIVLTNGNSMSIMDDDIFGPVSPEVRGHGKSKTSLCTGEKSSSQKKKKARKAAVLSLHPCVANGLDEISHISPLDHHTHSIRSISAKKSSSDSLENAMNAKKRKFSETLNSESDSLSHHILNSVTEFRVPKVEDPSAHDLSDIDIKMENEQIGYNNYNGHISNHHHHTHPLLHPHSGSATTAKSSSILSNAQLQHLLSQPDLRTLASAGHNAKLQRNQGINTVLNSVGSSDLVNSDGVITDASFDSTFDHSSQQDCDFSDDDLEKSLEFQIDPETEHQASRLLEDNELTEDDLNELFPETSNKIGRSDLSDLGDFTSAFDANDIDYSLFANIFPFSRSSQSESISISNQY